jgi:hypothetical protein
VRLCLESLSDLKTILELPFAIAIGFVIR